MADQPLIELVKNTGLLCKSAFGCSINIIKQNDDSVEVDFMNKDSGKSFHFKISLVEVRNPGMWFSHQQVKLEYFDKEIFVSAYPDVICAILCSS